MARVPLCGHCGWVYEVNLDNFRDDLEEPCSKCGQGTFFRALETDLPWHTAVMSSVGVNTIDGKDVLMDDDDKVKS